MLRDCKNDYDFGNSRKLHDFYHNKNVI